MSEYYVLGQEGEPVLIELGFEPDYGKILALSFIYAWMCISIRSHKIW